MHALAAVLKSWPVKKVGVPVADSANRPIARDFMITLFFRPGDCPGTGVPAWDRSPLFGIWVWQVGQVRGWRVPGRGFDSGSHFPIKTSGLMHSNLKPNGLLE